MADQDDIDEQLQLLKAHRSTLSHHLRQQALQGTAFAPPAVMHGIQEARTSIQRIKNVLRGWGIDVEDHPNDEEIPEALEENRNLVTTSKSAVPSSRTSQSDDALKLLQTSNHWPILVSENFDNNINGWLIGEYEFSTNYVRYTTALWRI